VRAIGDQQQQIDIAELIAASLPQAAGEPRRPNARLGLQPTMEGVDQTLLLGGRHFAIPQMALDPPVQGKNNHQGH
jgi:hypothetical protein